MASTFNLNIKPISEHLANRLKYNRPLAVLAVRELKEPTTEFPGDPSDTATLIKTGKWQQKYNHAYDQQKWWAKNTQKIYNLVMQHSMQEMKTKLLTMDSWTNTSTTQDGIALLKTICHICHKKDGGTDANTILDLVRMDKDMYLIHQVPTKKLSSYLSKFKGSVDVTKSSGGSPFASSRNQKSSSTNYSLLWTTLRQRAIIPPNTKRQPQKPTVATLLRYSSTASATNPTANSRKFFTTTPSQAPI